jgi:hypothetical protein
MQTAPSFIQHAGFTPHAARDDQLPRLRMCVVEANTIIVLIKLAIAARIEADTTHRAVHAGGP